MRAPGHAPDAGEHAAWRWLAGYVRPASGRLALVMALSLLAAAGGLAQPWLTMVLVDDGLLAGRHDVVLWTAGAMVALALTATGIGLATRLAYTATSARILHRMREDLFAHLLRLPPSWYARARQGDLLTRLDGDMAEVQRFAVDSLLGAVNSVVLIVGAVVVLYHLSPVLTGVLLVFMVVNAAILRALRPRLERLSRRTRERGADVAAFFAERLAAVKSVQAFNAEVREGARLAELHGAVREDTLRLQGVGYLAGSIPALVLAIGTAGVFVVGSHQMGAGGAMTLGTLIAFATYLQRATGPMQTLMGLYVALQRARVSLARVRELADEPVRVGAPSAPQPLPAGGAGAIAVRGVSFAYAQTAGAVLRDATIDIPAGSRVLLAGRSGAGKSTLIDLLHRHYDPDAGVIALDGVDLRRLDPAELRRAVAVVAQEVLLFSGSIAENIRYGCPGAAIDAVRAAAVAARVEEFARALPQGLDTPVGQRGLALSGGQRQRIAIARALLVAPRVLILDEGTSAVDPALEAEIRAEIDRLFAGRTRIFVSHRPLAEAEFDRVVSVDDGRVSTRAPLRPCVRSA